MSRNLRSLLISLHFRIKNRKTKSGSKSEQCNDDKKKVDKCALKVAFCLVVLAIIGAVLGLWYHTCQLCSENSVKF